MIELRTRRSGRKFHFVIALTLWLVSGCQSQQPQASIPARPSAVAASQPSTPPTAIPGTEESNPSQGCYYVWATRELPDLTAALAAGLAAVSPHLQGSAYAFGEECRSDSGTVTFLAMETDFRVRVAVATLADEDALGNAIQATMMTIDALPDDQMAGTRPGRVEFEFVEESSQSLRLTIDITRFRQEAGDRQGAALFRLFRTPG